MTNIKITNCPSNYHQKKKIKSISVNPRLRIGISKIRLEGLIFETPDSNSEIRKYFTLYVGPNSWCLKPKVSVIIGIWT